MIVLLDYLMKHNKCALKNLRVNLQYKTLIITRLCDFIISQREHCGVSQGCHRDHQCPRWVCVKSRTTGIICQPVCGSSHSIGWHGEKGGGVSGIQPIRCSGTLILLEPYFTVFIWNLSTCTCTVLKDLCFTLYEIGAVIPRYFYLDFVLSRCCYWARWRM